MRHLLRFGVLSLLAAVGLACQAEGQKADDKKDEKKGALVSLDGLSSRAPAEWQEKEATGFGRYKQFTLPKQGDDKADAEMIISFFGTGSGGGLEANIARWKTQVQPPAGKTIDDVAKQEELKVGTVKATYLDIAGTYLLKRRPNDPNEVPTPMPNYRIINVYFESPKGPYFFRLVGPEKTVTHHKKGFDEWLKNFK